jgi:NAD(P)-dependent dehydrogenase (short-subunit alcohol dehydrogenase family)
MPPQPLPCRATCAGVIAFQVTFTQALAGTGVRVQAYCPGLVDTGFRALAGRDLAATPVSGRAADEVVSAALGGLRLGEVVCVSGP